MKKILSGLIICIITASIVIYITNSHKKSTISKLKFHAWEAYVLENDKTQAIIVPQIGRLMSFKTQGGQNILRIREQYKNQLPSPEKVQRFGGFYTWLAPQKQWIDKTGKPKIFPFDFSLDIGPYTISRADKNRLTMISPVSKVYSIQLEKNFTLNPDGSLEYTVTLHNLANKETHWAIWNITAVEPNGTAIFQANTNDIKFHDDPKRDSGIFLPILKNSGEKNFLDLRKFKADGTKLYVQPYGNYLQWQQGNTVFTRKFEVDKSAEFTDHGTQIEIWADSKYDNYELETLSPYYTIPAEKSVSWKEILYLSLAPQKQ